MRLENLFPSSLTWLLAAAEGPLPSVLRWLFAGFGHSPCGSHQRLTECICVMAAGDPRVRENQSAPDRNHDFYNLISKMTFVKNKLKSSLHSKWQDCTRAWVPGGGTQWTILEIALHRSVWLSNIRFLQHKTYGFLAHKCVLGLSKKSSEQGSGVCLKEPDSKYFGMWVWGFLSQLFNSAAQKQPHTRQINWCSSVPIKLYLQNRQQAVFGSQAVVSWFF